MRNKLLASLFVLVGLFLFCCVIKTVGQGTGCNPNHTCNAADTSFAQVNGAVQQAIDGDTVVIPGGSSDWGVNKLVIDNKNITLKGSGIDASNGTHLTGQCGQITLNTKYTNPAGATAAEVRVTNMEINGGCGTNPSGNIIINGLSQNVRIDHILWNGNGRKLFVSGGWTYGVVDHCVTGATIGGYPHYLFNHGGTAAPSATPAGIGTPNGNVAWTERGIDHWGTAKMWYIEDNVWKNPQTHWIGSVNPGGGWTAVRHCSSDSQVGPHGTDSTGAYRGVRSTEVYHNYFDRDPLADGTTVEWRGGSGNMFNNRFATSFNGIKATRVTSYHSIENFGASTNHWYNSQDGTGLFDVNDRSTVPILGGSNPLPDCNAGGNGSSATNKPCVPTDGTSGTIFWASSTPPTLGTHQCVINSSATCQTLVFTGLPDLTQDELAGYVVRNASSDSSLDGFAPRHYAYLTQNPAQTTATKVLEWEDQSPAGVGRDPITFPTGKVEIRRALQTIDEVGSGKSTLLSNKVSTNDPTPNSLPVTIEREYVYQWNNLRKVISDPWSAGVALVFANKLSSVDDNVWDDVSHSVRGLRNVVRNVGYNDSPTYSGGSDHAYTYPQQDTSSLTTAQKNAYLRIGADDEALVLQGDTSGTRKIDISQTAHADQPDSTHVWGYCYPHPLVSGIACGSSAPPAPVINPPNIYTFVQDSASNCGTNTNCFTFSTSNFSPAPTFALTSIVPPTGAPAGLPTGVSFNTTTGQFTGNAHGSTLGDYTMTVTATSGSQVATAGFTLRVVNGVTNQAPIVSILAPLSGTHYIVSDIVSFQADAFDNDGSVAQVVFQDGATILATVTTPPYVYCNTFSVGMHTLTAQATDNSGNVSSIPSIQIIVDNSTGPTPTPPAQITIKP